MILFCNLVHLYVRKIYGERRFATVRSHFIVRSESKQKDRCVWLRLTFLPWDAIACPGKTF